MQDKSTTNVSNAKKRKIITLVIAVLVIALITAAPYMNLPFDIPTWGELLSTEEETSEPVDEVSAEQMPLTVHVIDVGQGDSILVKFGSHAMLIDAGERGNTDIIVNYLKGLGVEKLEYVVATHPHSDHIGSMPGVIEAFEVQNVIMPKLPKKLVPTTSIYKQLIKTVKASGAKTISAKPQAEYMLGDAKITILGPVGTPEDLNDASIVLRVDYGSNSFMFTGDAEAASEKRILDSGADVNADVLKMGHHGSSTSTCKEFFDAVSPSLALISCGADNDYGHPHRETLQLLKESGIDYERTDLKGTIIVGSDGKNLKTAFADSER